MELIEGGWDFCSFLAPSAPVADPQQNAAESSTVTLVDPPKPTGNTRTLASPLQQSDFESSAEARAAGGGGIRRKFPFQQFLRSRGKAKRLG